MKSRLSACLGILLSGLVLTAADRPATHAPASAVSREKLVGMMSDPELNYYQHIFEYAMDAVKPGEKYAWDSTNIAGEITVDNPFVSRNTICRNFQEVLSLKGRYSIHTAGIGCKRVGREGWCRLSKGDMLSCALEPPDNGVESLGRDTSEALERGSTAVRSDWWSWWPW